MGTRTRTRIYNSDNNKARTRFTFFILLDIVDPISLLILQDALLPLPLHVFISASPESGRSIFVS